MVKEQKVSVEFKMDLNDTPNKNGKYPYTITSINNQLIDDCIIWAKDTNEVQYIATKIHNITGMLKDGFIDNGEAKRLFDYYTK